MLNNVILMGRITKDLELKQISENSVVCNFDIAYDNVRKDANGEKTTSFISIVTFNGLAEVVVNNLSKGSKIVVTGVLEQRNYLRKDGSTASTYEIIASSIDFIDVKKKEVPQEDPKQTYQKSNYKTTYQKKVAK